MVLEHQSGYATQAAAALAIAPKIVCTAETLRAWLRQAEQDSGCRDGVTSDERQRIKALEREVRELRQANEILRKASADFASLSANEAISLSAKGMELDRPLKS